ncbi:MAG TPA: transketolase C-terminal domain-containing protein [Rectinemataceae bacterium]|nr:transketolase C-terminal domain-containing protein [Rectinemataceae bacterium]
MATEKKEMRTVYVETLIDLARANEDIVVLEADLMKATGTGAFAKAFPARAINVGVAEANMVGVASGLSSVGKIPFAATFGSFAGRRDYDQFFLSANYARLNVKLVGTDPGVMAKYNGGTHMPFEDLALMRAIPKLVIVEPSDPTSLERILRLAAAYYGCVYIRLQRTPANVLYGPDETFEFGKAKLLREGKDVLLVALGSIMVNAALAAADELAASGIRATVLDAISLKPLDFAAILEHATRTGRVVTCENAQASGGLGSAVAEALLEAGVSAKFARIGVKDEFGEVGTVEYLVERYGLGSSHIVAAAKGLM